MFVDRTGRRRRLATVLGAAFAVLLTSALGLVVAALLGAAPMPLPGLPTTGERQPEGGVPAPAVSRTKPALVRTPDTDSTTPANATTSGSPAPSTTTTPQRGNRPSTHPGNPKPSKTR